MDNMNFQLLPLELKYKIAEYWSIAELDSVLVHYHQPLDEHDTAFKNYLIQLRDLYQWWLNLGISNVASVGDLDGVIWLATNGANILDIEVIRKAAWSGNLDLVQWLYEHGADITDEWVIINASESGNLELMKWLKEQQ